MSGIVVFGDVVFFIAGFAAGYFAKPYIDAAISWVKAKF